MNLVCNIFSSELEEVYEQFARWLENPFLETEKGTKRELDTRELAVVRFAGTEYLCNQHKANIVTRAFRF